jgi:nucleoside phosphorylase
MTLLFAWATLDEAQVFLQTHNAKPLDQFAFSHEGGKSVIIGMGKAAIEKRLLPHLDKKTHLVNVGLAGALKKNLGSGHLFEIGSVCHQNSTCECGPKGLKLVTVTKPLYERKNYESQFDLVDMEGFFLAQFAIKYRIPYTLLKMVSDYCDEYSHETILSHLPQFSLAISDAITLRFQNDKKNS